MFVPFESAQLTSHVAARAAHVSFGLWLPALTKLAQTPPRWTVEDVIFTKTVPQDPISSLTAFCATRKCPADQPCGSVCCVHPLWIVAACLDAAVAHATSHPGIQPLCVPPTNQVRKTFSHPLGDKGPPFNVKKRHFWTFVCEF